MNYTFANSYVKPLENQCQLFFLQILAVFLIKPPPESDMDSMMPLVSPMNDVEFDEDSEEAGNNYYASERREESNPLVGGNNEGKWNERICLKYNT